MQISIDPDRCIGAARCVMAAPGVFTQDDDGVGKVIPGSETTGGAHTIRFAAGSCPVQAIDVE
jgi:ferredoxin